MIVGNIFLDLAWFKKNLAAFNDGMSYILVAVDELSQMIVAHPLPNKRQESWHSKIVEMILKDFTVKPNYFITDRQA